MLELTGIRQEAALAFVIPVFSCHMSTAPPLTAPRRGFDPTLPPLRFVMLAMLLVFGLGQIIFNAVYFIREDQERAIERAENRCKRDGSHNRRPHSGVPFP